MSPPRRRWWLWCAILLVLVSGWLLIRTPPGWYQPNQHASGAGERFEQLVVDQLTTLREQDQRWELSLDVASCNAFLAQRLRPWLQRESKGVLGMLDALGTPQMRMRPTDLASPPALILGFRGWSWMEVELQGQQDGATCTALELTRTRVGGLLPVPASSLGEVPTTITFPQTIPLQDDRTVVVDAVRFEETGLVLICRTRLAGSE